MEAIESGDAEHLLWWANEARELLGEIVLQHHSPDAPEYNECDVDRCMWCERASKLLLRPNISSKQ